MVRPRRGTASRWRWPCSTSTTSSRSTTRDGHAGGDRCSAGAIGPLTGSLRRSDRAFRVGGDEFAIILPDTDADGALRSSIRRLLATCLDGDGRRGADARRVVLGRDQRASRAAPATASRSTRQADAALFWGKRHGRTCVTVFDPERHEGAADRPQPAELSALVARVAATGAIRAVFQPIYDLSTGRAARLRGARSGRCPTAGSTIPARCSRPPRRPAGRPSSTSPA